MFICMSMHIHMCTYVYMKAKGQLHIVCQEEPGFEMESPTWGLLTRLAWGCKQGSSWLFHESWNSNPDPHACVVRRGRAISLLVLLL